MPHRPETRRPKLPAPSLLATVPFLAAILLLPLALEAQWPPEKLENLKVLPEDTEVMELMQTMRGFSFALGVRCQYCHVGEEGQPLTAFDFAADTKETKQRARTMLRMVKAINGEHLPALGKEADQLMRVECVTCHRGLARPEQLKDVLVRAALEGGASAAVEKYGQLRERYYGSHSYDFAAGSLVQTAEALLPQQQVASAIALLELNLEHHPESQWNLGTLAQARLQNDDREGAIEALEKLLELSPDNPRIKRQIEQLRGEGSGR